MKWFRTTIIGTCIGLLLYQSSIAQEASPYTENPLSETISISAVILGPFPPYYPPYTILPNTPQVQGVPITTDAGSDTVIFRGLSYPDSIVSLIKNGIIVTEVPASPNGSFEIRLRNLNPGTYTFGIRAQDNTLPTSRLETFTVFITGGITTLIEDILIAPAVSTDKSEVAWGDSINILGKSIPNATVNIIINSESKLLKKALADVDGGWQYTLDTHELAIGDHDIVTRSIIKDGISSLSEKIEFIVGSRNIARKKVLSTYGVNTKCDINADNKVNLIDFSIMAYWYKRDTIPKVVDLNNDGLITLTDFSILAYCWTG
jgi:hypothetical protein